LNTIRKILLIVALTSIMLLTLTASACRIEYNVSILQAEENDLDKYLADFDYTPYNFGEDFIFGIVVRKEWYDDEVGLITGGTLWVRTTGKETVEVEFGVPDLDMEKWNKLDVGTHLAFKDSPPPYWSETGLGFYVIRKKSATGFKDEYKETVNID